MPLINKVHWLEVTWETIDTHFEGIELDVRDTFGDLFKIPGWCCKHCGWQVGSKELPPGHACFILAERDT